MSQTVHIDTSQKVNLSQAAKLAGISRNTLHRHIAKGKLSKDIDDLGKPYIYLSELERVYGKLSHDDSNDTSLKLQPDTSNNDNMLQREIELLREQVHDLKEDRDRLLGIVEQQAVTVKQLTDQRQEKPASFWQRLRGEKS